MAEHFDVVVLGGGPGGYAAALYGAAAGLNIAIVEESRIGGTCLHRGCIPAKELLQTAEVLRTVRNAKEFGVDAGQPTVDLATSLARKQTVVDRLTKGLERSVEGAQGHRWSPAPARWSTRRRITCGSRTARSSPVIR